VKSTVFLGGGRITAALLAGLRLAGYRLPLVVYDRHLQKLRRLHRLYGVTIERNLCDALEQARLLVIAVRPDAVADLLRQIGEVDRSLTAVSLAAGVPLSQLRSRLRPPLHWARAMPSPLCRYRRGLTALTFDRNCPAASRRQVEDLFAQVGPVMRIPERQMDAFTVTYSPSLGYHALATLAAAGQKLGLDRRTALAAAAHALADAIATGCQGNTRLEGLLQEAATPGGTAAAVMEAMDRAGYQRVVARGLHAGVKRARRNAAIA